MDTDSFILALRRFIGRRENIRPIYVTMEAILWEQREQLSVGKRSIRRNLWSSFCKAVLIGFNKRGILH